MANYTFQWVKGNYGIRFIITQNPNESNNTSTVFISGLQIYGPGKTVMLDGQLYINGQHAWTASMYHGTHVQYVSGWTDETVGTSNTLTIPHNEDGTLTLTLTLQANEYGAFHICDYPDGNSLCSWTNGTAQHETATPINVGKVSIYTSSGWVKATPWVYTSSGWVKAIPYVYTSSGWQRAK